MELPFKRIASFSLVLVLMTVFWAAVSTQIYAQTYPQNREKSDAQICRKDDDCVVIANGCLTTAVNERHKFRAKDIASKINRELDTCEGEQSPLDPIAYCRYDVVECNTRNSRKVGTYCISERGQCSLIY